MDVVVASNNAGKLAELTALLAPLGVRLSTQQQLGIDEADETAATLMRAARVGVSAVIARPAKGEFMRMGRLLEAGALGIMYPRCESGEEAAELHRRAEVERRLLVGVGLQDVELVARHDAEQAERAVATELGVDPRSDEGGEAA